MGVPAFFRWLSKRCGSIVVNCVEAEIKEVEGVKIPVDMSEPNPNGIEFDNLYIDMNGVIHPCSHPEDRPAPRNEEEIFDCIFDALDRMFNIVRPRRLLYLAIDGCAPRAKMNQQRSRRFRAAKESIELKQLIEEKKLEIERAGGRLPPHDPKKEKFDSNCITPGTGFMHRLAKALRFYVAERLNSDKAWHNLNVILSDASVPGEGEHKIIDYIRRQRNTPTHDPNTHHCIWGADADLIMLGLSTHEPNFTIVREEFVYGKPKPCPICAQCGHEMVDCMGLPDDYDPEPPVFSKGNYIFIRIGTVREWIGVELSHIPNLNFPFDLENVIDDWVLLCFFVGNDFLPHLPSLEIREGAIDKLVNIYKRVIVETGGYMTRDGKVDLHRVECVMRAIGRMEDAIFRKRREDELSRRIRDERRKNRERNVRNQGHGHRNATPKSGLMAPEMVNQEKKKVQRLDTATRTAREIRQEAAEARLKAAELENAEIAAMTKSAIARARQATERSNDDVDAEDEVRLYEDGWKDRYFRTKFDVSVDDHDFRRKVVRCYTEGLCWVLAYYYQGCPDWGWYYPFHYAPFASDFTDLKSFDIKWDYQAQPRRPLEQLMCVFPAASGEFLPDTWQTLMSNPESPIIDFYPTDFSLDMNGKKFAWMGVALLPFIDEPRLHKTLERVYPDLTEEERVRNATREDVLFIGRRHPMYETFRTTYEKPENPTFELKEIKDDVQPSLVYDTSGDSNAVDCKKNWGIQGKCWPDPWHSPDDHFLKSPIGNAEDLTANFAISVCFKNPLFTQDFVFPSKILDGAKFPENVLKPKSYGHRANAAPRDWRKSNYTGSGAHVADAGHRMANRAMGGQNQGSQEPDKKKKK